MQQDQRNQASMVCVGIVLSLKIKLELSIRLWWKGVYQPVMNPKKTHQGNKERQEMKRKGNRRDGSYAAGSEADEDRKEAARRPYSSLGLYDQASGSSSQVTYLELLYATTMVKRHLPLALPRLC